MWTEICEAEVVGKTKIEHIEFYKQFYKSIFVFWT